MAESFSTVLKREVPITDYAERLGFTLVRKGRYYSLKEHDSVIIDTDKNCFWRNSRFSRGYSGGAGSVIDFAIEFSGAANAREAMRELSTMYGIHGQSDRPQLSATSRTQSQRRGQSIQAAGTQQTPVFTLPERAKDNSAVFRYLTHERQIQRGVIRYFLARDMLYQDERRNCVFHTDSFACLRSTGDTRFVGDVSGSDYNECFYFRGSNGAKKLIVAESVIDVMSVMSYLTLNNHKFTDYCFLALSGTNKLESVFHHLQKEGAGLDTVILCLDNDEAGHKAVDKIQEGIAADFPNTECRTIFPPSGKDWNDYIKTITPERTAQGKPKPHTFSVSRVVDNEVWGGGLAQRYIATDENGVIAGTLSFQSDSNEKPHVTYIETAEDYKRQGVATLLFQTLQRDVYPTEIDYGMTTPDGTALLNAITVERPNPQGIASKNEYDRLQSDLAALQSRLDYLYDLPEPEGTSPEVTAEIDSAGERWQNIYDTIRRIENDMDENTMKTSYRYINFPEMGEMRERSDIMPVLDDYPINQVAMLDYINNPMRTGTGGIYRDSNLFRGMVEQLGKEQVSESERREMSNELYRRYDNEFTKQNLLNGRRGYSIFHADNGQYEELRGNYELVYQTGLESLPEGESAEMREAENIFIRLNDGTPHPADYYGVSLSVGDIVVFHDDFSFAPTDFHAYRVDSFGFSRADELLTPEMIARMTNRVTVREEAAAWNGVVPFYLENGITINAERAAELANEYDIVFRMADIRGVLSEELRDLGKTPDEIESSLQTAAGELMRRYHDLTTYPETSDWKAELKEGLDNILNPDRQRETTHREDEIGVSLMPISDPINDNFTHFVRYTDARISLLPLNTVLYAGTLAECQEVLSRLQSGEVSVNDMRDEWTNRAGELSDTARQQRVEQTAYIEVAVESTEDYSDGELFQGRAGLNSPDVQNPDGSFGEVWNEEFFRLVTVNELTGRLEPLDMRVFSTREEALEALRGDFTLREVNYDYIVDTASDRARDFRDNVNAAMREAGYERDIYADTLTYRTEDTSIQFEGGYREAYEWLDGVVFDEPERNEAVERVLHPERYESREEMKYRAQNIALTDLRGIGDNGYGGALSAIEFETADGRRGVFNYISQEGRPLGEGELPPPEAVTIRVSFFDEMDRRSEDYRAIMVDYHEADAIKNRIEGRTFYEHLRDRLTEASTVEQAQSIVNDINYRLNAYTTFGDKPQEFDGQGLTSFASRRIADILVEQYRAADTPEAVYTVNERLDGVEGTVLTGEDLNRVHIEKTAKEADILSNPIVVQSAARSNIPGYVVMTQFDRTGQNPGESVFLGLASNYRQDFDAHTGIYYNADNSLIHVSDNPSMSSFLNAGQGWVLSQKELIDNGGFTEADYAEYDRIRREILVNLPQAQEKLFSIDMNQEGSGVPFTMDWQSPTHGEYGEIVAKFQSSLNMENGYINRIAIIREADGYHNHFLFDEDKGKGAAGTGAFAYLEQAKQDVRAHYPDAQEVQEFTRESEGFTMPENQYGRMYDERLGDETHTAEEWHRLVGNYDYAVETIEAVRDLLNGEAERSDNEEFKAIRAAQAEEIGFLAARERAEANPEIDTSLYNVEQMKLDFIYITPYYQALDEVEITEGVYLSVACEGENVIVSLNDRSDPEQGEGHGASRISLDEFKRMSQKDFDSFVGQVYSMSMEYTDPEREPERTAELEEALQDYVVLLEAGRVTREFMTFPTQEEAEQFIDDNKGSWRDENDFEWGLSLMARDREVMIQNVLCRQIDEWVEGGDSFILGQPEDEPSFYYARVTNGDITREYEFDHKPTHEEVLDAHIDRLSMEDIDRHEAEYGADGYRAFPGDAPRPLSADSVTDIAGKGFEYNEVNRQSVYTFDCRIDGVPATLTYTQGQTETFRSPLSDRGDIEDTFHIYTDGAVNLWEELPPSELRRLETRLHEEADFYMLNRGLEQATDANGINDAVYAYTEDENLFITPEHREQFYEAVQNKALNYVREQIAAATPEQLPEIQSMIQNDFSGLVLDEEAKEMLLREVTERDTFGNRDYFQRFYAPQDRAQMEQYESQHPDYKRVFASDEQGENGDTWVVYRNVSDLPRSLRDYATEQESIQSREAERRAQEQSARMRAEQERAQAAERTHGEDEQETPKDKLSRQLLEGVAGVMNTENFRAWLDTSARLFTNNYSFRNALLIFAQKPEASYCMGYEAWKEFGRNVQKGAKGAQIFVPVIAYEKTDGALFRMIKGNLDKQLKENPAVNPAIYRVGMSKMEFTLNHAGVWGLRLDGKEQSVFGNETQVKRFIQNNVLNKVPMYFTVGTVFDVKDTATPEYLWLKKGFTKDEMVRDEKGKAVKNNRGEYKIKNTPERIAKFNPTLEQKIVEHDPAKMAILLEALKAVAERNGVPVREMEKEADDTLKGGAKGYFSRTTNNITLDTGLAPTEKAAVLLHEMGHADLHGDLDKLQRVMGEKVPREMREVQAESVAYAVARQFGITTDTSSFAYIAAWSRGTQTQDLAKSLDVIYGETKKLTKEIAAELDVRGLNLDLSEKPKAPLLEETRKDLAAAYMTRAIAADEKNKDILSELPKTAEQYKDKRELLDNLAQQQGAAVEQQKSIAEVKTLCDSLLTATDRSEQDALIAKLDAGMKRIEAADGKIETLADGFMKLCAEQSPGRYEDFYQNPQKVVSELKENFPTMFEGLSESQVDYIAKSDYIQRDIAPLLKEDSTGEKFAQAVTQRAAAIEQVAAKNGAFVEIAYCEQWTEKPIVQGGALLHPNVANSIIKQGEAELMKLRKEAESKGEYFPYNKCKLTVYTLDESKKQFVPHVTRVDIGDGYQSSLSTFLHKEIGADSPISKAFDVAIRERGAKDKALFNEAVQTSPEAPEAPGRAADAQEKEDKSVTLEEAKQRVADEKGMENAGGSEPSREDKKKSKDRAD